MRKLLVFWTLISIITMQAQAQNFKFGHINTTELISVMPQTDSAKVKLEAYIKDNRELYEALRVEYNKMLEEFSTNQEKWSDVVKESKQSDLLEKQSRIADFEQKYQEKYAQEQEKLFTPIREKVKTAIDKVAKANSFTYIFDLAAGNPIYFSETQSVDILPLVKKELGIK
ncbi:MAG: OmpH family outer membrane protein [Prevotellaceae bacterium]|jgi:outer membrane protein|nr:OmpH family outer membrane protein [Prevotellaceae bacterium]